VFGAGQLPWLERLEREQANLRGALTWYLEREPQAAAELAACLWQFWRVRAHYTEGLDWLTRALASAPGQTRIWARAALAAGILARDVGDMATAHTQLTASLACSRALGEPGLVAFALRDLAGWHIHRGDFTQAVPLLREALRLARAAGDQRGQAGTLMFQAWAAGAGGNSRRAWVLNQAGLARARVVGDRWLIAAILLQLGSLAVEEGDFYSAMPLLEEGLQVSRALGVPTRAGQFQWQLARVALAQGEPDRALPLLESLQVASRERQSPRGSATALVDLARVAQVRGARREALALLREALRLRDAVSDRLGSIECLERLAAVDAGVEPLHTAWLLGATVAARRALGAPPSRVVQQELAETARIARAASEATFSAAQAAGECVPLEQAIAQGLQATPDTDAAESVIHSA
jgi:tetratricopeptide (TPR) repeat protein